MEMINDRVLAPLLLQVALYSAIDATERTLGTASFKVRGRIEFDGSTPPIQLNNAYTGDFNVPLQASLGTAIPLAYVMQSGFDGSEAERHSNRSRVVRPQEAIPDRAGMGLGRQVRPGGHDRTDYHAGRRKRHGDDAQGQLQRSGRRAPGTLYFTVADAASSQFERISAIADHRPADPAQLVSFINGLRGSDKAYVRVWTNEAAYTARKVRTCRIRRHPLG